MQSYVPVKTSTINRTITVIQLNYTKSYKITTTK